MRVLALILAITLFPVAIAHAQPAGGALDSGAAVAPVPPRDYVAQIRNDFTPESRAYSSTRTALAFVEPLYTIIVALVLLSSGLSARMRDLAGDLAKRRYPRMLVYFVLYSVAAGVLMLPFLWAGDFALEHRFGLSNQSLGGWFGDQAKAFVLQIVFLGVLPILALAYRRLESSPRRWWLWFAGWSFPLITATVLIQPLVIEPAFNKFTPLRDAHLRDRILALAARADIPAGRVDEVDRSAQTNKYNAYVSGFGASQHIVLWDTTLRGMDEREILFVTGHEIGHFKLGHIWKGIVIDSLLSVGVFLLTWLIARALAQRFGPSWGFTQLHDLASLPMLAAVLNTVVFIVTPAYNAFSREAEHEADVYALEITRDNDAGARSYIKLGAQNRSDPEPSTFVKWVLFTHPPLIERVRFATEYRPWREGRPNRFFKGAVSPGG
jgi:STE24 endopeptidase